MLSGREELSGGIRLANIRKLKRYLYAVQIAMIIIIPVLVVIAEGRFSLKPFYLPVNSFIYFIILMLLIVAVESFFFKVLELRLIRSDSTKYYIAKTSTRRSYYIIGACVVVVVFLWTPFMAAGIQDAFSTKGSLDNTGGVAASQFVAFYDRDALGLTSVDKVTISSENGRAYVYLVSSQNYENNKDNISKLMLFRINTAADEANPTLTIDMSGLPFGQYYLVLDTLNSDATSISYTIHPVISPTFVGYVPFFALLFIVTHIGWVVYLRPMMKKYSSHAIYK
ncbi:MAG: hypothetical protein LUO79_02110 [Methanomassiliicoccales archaeon]|nr:hypothetical protein [Methanomassiliicoccales archaeon]